MRISRSFISDLFKYGFVAVFALVADAGTLWFLHSRGVQYLIASTVAFVVGTVVNFALSHGYVFKDPVIKNRLANFGLYTAIGAVSLVFNDVIIWLCHSELKTGLALSKAVAVAIVFFWNFIARRQFLYRGKDVAISKEISFES